MTACRHRNFSTRSAFPVTDPESPEAGIRLDKIDAKHWKEFSLLEDIYAVLESGEMPPQDAPTQPEQSRSDALRKVLAKQLGSLAAEQKPGMLKD